MPTASQSDGNLVCNEMFTGLVADSRVQGAILSHVFGCVRSPENHHGPTDGKEAADVSPLSDLPAVVAAFATLSPAAPRPLLVTPLLNIASFVVFAAWATLQSIRTGDNQCCMQ